MNNEARLAVVLPNGVFFRGGAELALRKDLITRDLVEAIIQLPPDLFYGAGIPACILVLNKAKANERKGRVLMIDNSSGFERRETKNVLTDDGIARVIATYKSGDEEDGWSRWVSDEEIASHRYALLVPRYFGSDTLDGEIVPLDDALGAYRAARDTRATHERALAFLDDVVAASRVGEGGWRTLALRDLATPAADRVKVEADAEFRIAGVLNAGKGLFWRETIRGAETTYPFLHRLHAGQLVYRKLTAWEGPITVVPEEFEGAFVSTEFPAFTLDESTIYPPYMRFVCQRPAFWDEMRLRSRGTAVRRSRMNPDDLLDVELEVPPLDVQRLVVDTLMELEETRTALAEEARAAGVLSASTREALLGWTEDGASEIL
jgi:N-6 DNA Methylase